MLDQIRCELSPVPGGWRVTYEDGPEIAEEDFQMRAEAQLAATEWCFTRRLEGQPVSLSFGIGDQPRSTRPL